MKLGEALALTGVPEGCGAHPRLVADGANYRLPRDRSGRAKITAVEIRASGSFRAASLDARDERFVYGANARRWKSIRAHFQSNEQAWLIATDLCRAGTVEITCSVVDGTRLGQPSGWRLTTAAQAEVRRRNGAAETAADVARSTLATAGLGQAKWIEGWISDSRRSGLLRRSAKDGTDLLRRAAACITALPTVSGGSPISRNELAARYGGGDAHALDDGHRLTALVLRAAAAIVDADYPNSSVGRRQLWAQVGIVADRVSSTVLVANLRPSGNGLLARQLRERTQARLPTHLCARDLDHEHLALLQPESVFAFENPRVLEAALDAGATATLVCVQGSPTIVTVELLTQLAQAGCTIAYRGDFDWPGIAIANRLIAEIGCSTWLYDTETYRGLLASSQTNDHLPLAGVPVQARWDNELSDAMIEARTALHEEALLDDVVTHLLE